MSRNGTGSSPHATWARAAVAVGIVDALVLLGTGLATAAEGIHSPILEDGAVVNLVAGLTFPLLAALMLRDCDASTPRSQQRLAWLLLGLGVLTTGTLLVFTYAAIGLREGLPLATAVAWMESWLWTPVAPGLTLLLLWFPSGEVVLRPFRWVGWAAVASFACLWLGTAFAPGVNTDFAERARNPVGSAAVQQVLGPLGGVGHVLLAGTFLAAVASLGIRYWRGDARVRAQLGWLLLAALVFTATTAFGSGFGVLGVLSTIANLLATVLLPVTLAVALTRGGHTLPRVLVFGFLSTLLLIAYLGIVAGAQAVFGERADKAAALVAAGVIAVGATPLRARLQRAVDRLVYGDRGDPYAVLTDLGRRIVGSPDDLLAEVVVTVARALRAPYVAVELSGETEPAAATGEPAQASVAVPLTVRGREVGRLVVAQRNRREAFGPRDLRLLEELGRPIAVAAHAAALTRDLQHSGESLVIAREEERRRIRRDLHDGLGPALAGVAFGIDAARNTLRRDPAATDRALAEIKAEVQTSLGDVRRLVYDLRPPALDRLGLVPAIEEYAARLRERTLLQITVFATGLPSLPAAVEVAAYRIVTEALTNVVRHSGATHSSVVLAATGGRLHLTVTDDGRGIEEPRDHRSGVGLTAMPERAAELGGTCVVLPGAEGGTSVIAELPLWEAL
ncbi:MAG: GAF domain-containing sensor histidine kinase [Blastococcus sp.]